MIGCTDWEYRTRPIEKMTKILMLTPQMPYPPEQGTSLRNFHILRGLVDRHQISVLTFRATDSIENKAQPEELAPIRFFQVPAPPRRSKSRRLISLVSINRPDLSYRLRSEALENRLVSLLSEGQSVNEPYDIVQIEGLELAYLLPAIKLSSPNTKIVLDQHNAETLIQSRSHSADKQDIKRWPKALYSKIQAGRLEQYESWACQNADWVTVVSQSDRHHLLQLIPDIKTSIVPNSIDVDEYREKCSIEGIPFDILFTGKMDYRPNVDSAIWFAQAIWPIIRKARPTTTWAIVGQKPTSNIQRLNDLNGVTVTGYVKEVAPYMAGAKVFVLPFRVGSGTRLKMIEAMAAGKAIVSTEVGAEGYGFQNNEELIMADEPKQFANAVLNLLSRPEERLRLGQAAVAAAHQYDWRVVIPKFDEVYEGLVS